MSSKNSAQRDLNFASPILFLAMHAVRCRGSRKDRTRLRKSTVSLNVLDGVTVNGSTATMPRMVTESIAGRVSFLKSIFVFLSSILMNGSTGRKTTMAAVSTYALIYVIYVYGFI